MAGAIRTPRVDVVAADRSWRCRREWCGASQMIFGPPDRPSGRTHQKQTTGPWINPGEYGRDALDRIFAR